MDNMFKSMNENLDKLLLAQSSQQNVSVVRRSQFQDQQGGYQQQQWGTPHGFVQQQSQAPQFQEPDMRYMQSGYDPYADHYGDDLQSGSWGSSDGFPQPTHYAEHDYHPHGFSTPDPYAGYIGDDLQNGSWERSDGFHQPTPYAQQVYYPPDLYTPGPSHAPPPQDTDMMSMLQQLLQGQADCSLMLNTHDFSTPTPSHAPPPQDTEMISMLQQILQSQEDISQRMQLGAPPEFVPQHSQTHQLNTNFDAWVSPQENTNSRLSNSTPLDTLPMHQDMDPTECYNEWSVDDNTTQAEQEYAYDAIEYALKLESEDLYLEFDLASTSPKVQHTTLNVDIKELSEGDELKFSEMLVVNNENESGIEEHSQLLYGPSVESYESLENEITFQDGTHNDKKEEASKSVEREEQQTFLTVDIDEQSKEDDLKFTELRVINKEKREALFEKIEYPYVPLSDEPNFPFAGVISAIDVSLEDPMTL